MLVWQKLSPLFNFTEIAGMIIFTVLYIAIYSPEAALKLERRFYSEAGMATRASLSRWQKWHWGVLCLFWSAGTGKVGQARCQTAGRIGMLKLLTCDQSCYCFFSPYFGCQDFHRGTYFKILLANTNIGLSLSLCFFFLFIWKDVFQGNTTSSRSSVNK